ncbi:MAG: hypothetical protein QG625_2130 [Cyanobacteriota bacterium erpe_2018_sw_39hr_WHONDRS-SW48-000098_B_bin.30]|jgi:hypothetical protein|nr:hypothetical protein [Cyanobacteriota bacterium erpe_2018_sw_39hr_WHONDRS-SW48-000098_B_bin.30]
MDQSNPKSRLTPEEIEDLEVVVQLTLPDDTKAALIKNFPPEQLQEWDQVHQGLSMGWLSLHELRSKATGELLSARLMVVYPARVRTEAVFILVAWVVTPDQTNKTDLSAINQAAQTQSATSQLDTKAQGKGNGYGSYLRPLSYDISRAQNPHALGLVAERESPEVTGDSQNQSIKRASWMKRIGLLQIENLAYEIPPHLTDEEKQDKYVPVAERKKPVKKADLLLTRFDGQREIDGHQVYSMVERIYADGYHISPDDPYMVERLKPIDKTAKYRLVGD